MRGRLLALFVASVMVVPIAAVKPVAAAQPSTAGLRDEGAVVLADALTLELAAAADLLPGPVTATATLSGDPGGGSIIWKIDDWGTEQVVPVGAGGVTTLDLGTRPAGAIHLYARFGGFDAYPATAFVDIHVIVHAEATVTLTANRSTAYKGELPVVLTATVTTSDSPPTTVTFVDDVAGSIVELGPVAVDQLTGKASFSSNALRLGVHSIIARYDGSSWTLPSPSAPVAVTVLADTSVHATFTASLTKFYPYADGIKDTVRLAGRLDERASVTIRVYNSSSTLKRTWSLGTRNAGAYGVTWNGRTSGGSRLPAGTYKVKASFKDVLGHARSIYHYVTISWREATWKTGTVITRYGDQFTYYADQELDRLFTSPDYSRGRTMDAGSMFRDCDPCAFVYGTRSFQLTTSAIAYRKVYATLYGHGYSDREHPGTGYVVNPTSGAWEQPTSLPEFMQSGVTYNIVIPASYVNSSDQVKVVLYMTQMWGDAWDVHYLKLHYQYAVWK